MSEHPFEDWQIENALDDLFVVLTAAEFNSTKYVKDACDRVRHVIPTTCRARMKPDEYYVLIPRHKLEEKSRCFTAKRFAESLLRHYGGDGTW